MQFAEPFERNVELGHEIWLIYLVERRVTSVKAVAKITNTMKLVAQAKLNSARNRAAKTTVSTFTSFIQFSK